MLDAWIRNTCFWAIDRINSGGKVINHYNNIKEIIEGSCKDNVQKLNTILQHAIDTVPFYENITKPVLEDFPVITKSTYKQEFNAFQSNDYLGHKLHTVRTSGSTGTPFTANQDMDKRNRNIADFIYFHRARGWELGAKFIFLHAWRPDEERSKLSNFMQNVIPFNVLHFDDSVKALVRNHLKKDRHVRVILGYSSALGLLADYLIERGDDSSMFNIKVIFADSDTLTAASKNKIEKIFACPVIDRYSNEEHGLLACTKAYEDQYYINRASYYIELLKLNEDQPADPGEIGRIVVTDLHNKAMPFIRYDVGDLAISLEEDRANLSVLHSLQGRRSDVIFDTNGNAMTEAALSHYLDYFQQAKRYQFCQIGNSKYILKLECSSDAYKEDVIIDRMRACLGNEADITVEFVDNIPVSKTGKYRSIINNC